MAKRIFTMNGEQYSSMSAIAKELGIKRLYPRDFDKYGVAEITEEVAQDSEETAEEVAVEETKEEVAAEETKEEVAKDETPAEEVTEAEKEADDPTDNDEAETEDEKSDEDVKGEKTETKSNKSSRKTYTIEELVKMPLAEYSKFLRKVDTDDLITFAADNQLETFEEVSDTKIRRMKVAMAIKAKFFPGQTLPAKKSSFKGVDVDQLTAFADENNVEYKKAAEPKIQKMWVIYALNQAGFTELPQAAATKENA